MNENKPFDVTYVEILCPICGEGVSYDVRFDANVDLTNLDFAARRLTKKMNFRTVVCQGCGLVYSNPIIDSSTIEKLYEKAYFVSESQLSNMANDYFVEFLKHRDLFTKPLRLLEVGCANGFFLEKVLDSDLEIDQICGVEPGFDAFESASERVQKYIINDFLKEGQYEPHSFDVICSFQVFDHILEPNEFLTLVKKLLKPDGYFFQIHHNIKSPLPTLLRQKASTYDMEHIHLWDHKTMDLILEKNGMSLVEVRNITTSYMLGHVFRMSPLPPLIKKPIMKLLQVIGLYNVKVRLYVENMAILSQPSKHSEEGK